MNYSPLSRAEQRERRRKAAFIARVITPNDGALRVCPIPGCGRPPQARAGRGLSLTHCRFHIQHRNRHGSMWKGTYTASELLPYRKAVKSHLAAHRRDAWVQKALIALGRLLENSGPVERMTDVRRMNGRGKARVAFARMRRAEVPPLRILVNYLAVTAAIQEDPIRPGGEPDDYRLTQIGKRTLRLASGLHATYSDGSKWAAYARSSGQSLRWIGREVDRVCEHVAARHLAAILDLKVTLYGARPQDNRPRGNSSHG